MCLNVHCEDHNSSCSCLSFSWRSARSELVNWQLYQDTCWDWTGLYLQKGILISKHLKIFEVFFYKKKCFKGFKTNLCSLLSFILAVPFLLWRYSEHEEATTAETQQISRMKRTENAIDSVYWTNSRENVIVEKSLIFSFKQ